MKSFYKNNISGLLHNCDVEDRELLIEKLEEAFGQENVVPISNFNTMQLKSLVKDMSKFYGVPFEESNACTKKMDFEILPELKKQDRAVSDMRYEDAIAFSPAFREYMRKYPLIDEKIKILFRQPKAIGKHAGGVIVTENPGIGMPLIKVRGKIQSPWSEGLREKYLEPYGLIKFDLLGLKTLRIITRCARLILQRHVGEKTQICLSKAGRVIEKFSDEMCESKTYGEMSDQELKDHFKFSDAIVYRYSGKDMSWPNVKKWIESHLHPDSINDMDEHVYKHVFDEGRFPGIFQFTEGGAQSFIKKFKPRNIIDIAMATAIYRPGPLKAKVDQLFLDARSGGETGIMDHPALEKVFGETFGYCIFQEQIQHVAKEFAGFDPIDAFKLLKAIVKKVTSKAGEQKTETEILQEKFINGAIENGYDKDKAELLYEKLKFFAQYGFNKCLQINEEVIINGDVRKKIKDVVPGDMIRSRDEKTGQDIQVRVKAVHKNGIKKLVKLTLTTGEVVKCTLDHKFRVVETSEMLPLYEILEKKYSIEVKK